ncbi:50S ribosomal protein L24e [archaeon]|nr:50S ribosomal protein L24e [archaeon]
MKCSFCKKDIEEGRGSLIAKKDGKVIRFCSNKCRKNHLMGRSAQRLKWVTKERKK